MGEVGGVRCDEIICVAPDGRKHYGSVLGRVKNNGPVEHVDRADHAYPLLDCLGPSRRTGRMLQNISFNLSHAIVRGDKAPTLFRGNFDQVWDKPLTDQHAARIVDVSRKTITSWPS